MHNRAAQVIDRFGGVSALARALGHKWPTTVQGWKTRGVIPAGQQQKIPLIAQAAGMMKQLAERDRAAEIRKFRDVLPDGIVERDLAVLRQHQDCSRGELL